MEIALNREQTKSLAAFLSNMAVALYIGALISPVSGIAMSLFIFFGTICLYSSLRLLRKIK